MEKAKLQNDYGLSKVAETNVIVAPDLPYLPREPQRYLQSYWPRIGVIGCGGIAGQQLNAYKEAGYQIVALCDHTLDKAQRYQAQFFPDAFVTTNAQDIFNRADIEVVDITTHPADRVSLIESALRAHKHVLSQKPFVTDLDIGTRLCDLADAQGVKLAVNQNGRWAPHFSYMNCAIKAELIGAVQSVNFTLHWDHTWIIGTPFQQIASLLLTDFGIHWFDMAAIFFAGRAAQSVYAINLLAAGQQARVPMLAHALIEFDGGTAALNFNANVAYGQEDKTVVAGTLGTLMSVGPSLSEQLVTLHTAAGTASPTLKGTWFVQGFHGALAELLCAIEENRPPANNARDNLQSLALCFAAVASARERKPIAPGTVRKLIG
ncbi:MAG: Gfo/Idh/MocA family oxidoreductase [Acidobacteria bacterium]|nr:Gfo/Idh/MocA family oxidoreductase [Acidobacteriota bacterium]